MTQFENELSNLSYTNKDFGTIYPELLDLAKKISYKWDPTTSNESDPGVVLLKLAALMADKLNYNIDKNILELFPLSVTQETNARQLFEQCGYCMQYYQSASVTLNLTLINEPEIKEADYSALNIDENTNLDDISNIRTYVLPKYTMISNLDNDVIYTLLESVELQSDGITVSAPALQGVINTYTINGESLITSANLDYNNRIYFTGLDIAENGIFIEGGSINDTWKKVDNLIIQPLGTLCYKFGISTDGQSCYIEFPSDIESLIGEGITIHYLRTKGYEGNIGRNHLSQFYTDTTATRYLSKFSNYKQDITVTNENIYIANPLATINGKNPETIKDAYKNYEKIKTTFETLVSLKDYKDFMITNHNVSNGVVFDRTNDIQSSYQLINHDNQLITKSITDTDGNPLLSAFDLKVYALKYINDPTTDQRYDTTFELIPFEEDGQNTFGEFYKLNSDHAGWGELKCIQHDFKDYENDEIIFIKNIYPITAKIIPYTKITTLQQSEILRNIFSALYKVLNSQKINLGEAIDYNLVYDTIMESDTRMRALILDDISYQTYAIYRIENGDGSKEFKEIRIDSNSTEPILNEKDPTLDTDEKVEQVKAYWNKFRNQVYVRNVLAGNTQLLTKSSNFTYSLLQKNLQEISDLESVTTNSNLEINIEAPATIGTSRSLADNENLLLIAPNFKSGPSYSTYTKFYTNFNYNTAGLDTDATEIVKIRPEDVYSLQETEYIIFFWKPSEDANYNYIKYTNNSPKYNTFSPNFSLMCKQPPLEFKINDSNYTLPVGVDPFAVLSNSGTLDDYMTVTLTSVTDIENTVTIKLNEYVARTTGNSYVMSGTNTITMKAPIILNLTEPSSNIDSIYWILNNTIDNKYQLFNAGEESYYLQPGEYLIYTNKSKSQINLLGSGTQIKREGSNLEMWSVDVVKYDDFISDPLTSLHNKWFKLDARNYTLKAQENQFIQLGSNYQLELAVVNKTDPYEGDTISISNQFSNNNILANYRISYIDDSDIKTSLPYYNRPEYSWKAKTLLNIDCSSTRSQRVIPGQSLAFIDSSGITHLIQPGENEEYQIFSDKDVFITGGINVNVKSIDLTTGQESKLRILKYEYDKSQWEPTNPTQYSVDINANDLSFTVGFTGNLTDATFNIDLLPGDYILPIYCKNNFQNFTVTLKKHLEGGNFETIKVSDVASIETNNNEITTYSSVGNHLLWFTIPELVSGQSLSISFKVDGIAGNTNPLSSSFEIKSLYKFVYDDNEVSPFTDLTQTLEFINDFLGNKSNQFNYIYQVENPIIDPLDSKSFLDSRHVYNPITICKWNKPQLGEIIIDQRIR